MWNDGYSMTLPQWKIKMEEMGQRPFRACQLFSWLHQHQVASYDDMTNLPVSLRETLKEKVPLETVKIALVQRSAKDGTRKYLMTLSDHEQVETVLMQYHYGYSLCISSQVGCRMGCRFCASTLSGKKRDLLPGEMVQQIYRVEQEASVNITHVVIMGCGEPFDNYDALLRFLELIHAPEGKNLSLRNITVSTCGLPEPMRRFIDLDLPVTLAVSLHAPNDEIRKKLMPVAHRVTMEELLDISRLYTEKTHRRITFEYALAQGINDELKHARELAHKLSGMLAHVNLIPVNPVTERGMNASVDERVQQFRNELENLGIEVTVRREMGRDIDAACGQLRRKYELEREDGDESSSTM